MAGASRHLTPSSPGLNNRSATGGGMVQAERASAGLRNVVVSESQISSIDGTRGILAYRGIDIHALAEHSSFEEVVYLLHQGTLPGRAALQILNEELVRERGVPPEMLEILRRLPRDTHPMASL